MKKMEVIEEYDFFFYPPLFSLWLCVYMLGRAWASAHVWGSEDNLSFHLCVGSEDGTWSSGWLGKHLYLLNHLSGQKWLLQKKCIHGEVSEQE